MKREKRFLFLPFSLNEPSAESRELRPGLARYVELAVFSAREEIRYGRELWEAVFLCDLREGLVVVFEIKRILTSGDAGAGGCRGGKV